MANYRIISTTFWTDSKVDDEFTPEDKYFYLYLLTNPHTNICGCYEISPKQMARESGYNEATIKKLIEKMVVQYKVVSYDYDTKEILLHNWSKYNWTSSPKLKKSVQETAKYIKNESFKKWVLDVVEIGYAYPIDTSASVSVSASVIDTEIEKNEEQKRFKKPSLEEVKEYCEQRENNVDAQRFVDFYASKGWRVGNQPMKDWKACVRTWESRSKKFGATEMDVGEQDISGMRARMFERS